MRCSVVSAALALSLAHLTSAQTYTDCNPTEKTCPSDNALGKTITVDFTEGASDQFTVAEGTTLTYDSTNGAAFSISDETQAPTISSAWYIFFGKIDVVLKASPGQGIVSSFVLESDDLDEIDWEWLGGDTTQVESNYFGKGNTTSYDRAIYHSVSAPQSNFRTYTIDWTKEAIKWSIDGTLVRTLAYADALSGKNYPQTPMRVKMGNWVGGSSTAADGTVEWAGGLSDFSSSASLPYSMYVQSVTIEDYTTSGSTYAYSDLTGSYDSITISGAAGGSGATNTTDTSSSSSSGSTSGSFTKASTVAHLGSAPTGSASTTLTRATSTATSTASSVTSGTSDSSSATTASSNSSSVTSASSSAAIAVSTGGVSGKYGMLDIGVGVLGLALGYLVM